MAGTRIATKAQTFAIPYRPLSEDDHCTSSEWFDGRHGCFNGLATNITSNRKLGAHTAGNLSEVTSQRPGPKRPVHVESL